MQHDGRKSLRILIWSSIMMQVLSCAEDSEKSNARNISEASGAATPQAVNSAPDQSEAGDNADSLALFSETVHPILKARCATCHAAVVAPFMAHSDAAVAHEALLSGKKVDLANVAQSRLILRLSQDNHNCWSQCAKDAEEMQAAVQEWATKLAASAGAQNGGLKTAELSFADRTAGVNALSGYPGTMVMEAENGTLGAAMASLTVATASGGRVVHTPAGAGSQTTLAQAASSTTLGTLKLPFDVQTAGDYRVHGLVSGPAANNDSFYLRMDSASLLPWIFSVTPGQYLWDLADAGDAAKTPHVFNLSAGRHTLEIRQRKEQAKVDVVILTNDPAIDPAAIVGHNAGAVHVLLYDISSIAGVAGAKLSIEVEDYSDNAYLFKNPRLITPKPLKVKDLKLLINGHFLPQHATYTVVDTTVAAPGALLSSSALVALKDKGAKEDKFSFTFESLSPQ